MFGPFKLETPDLSRRSFLRVAGGAGVGLIVGRMLPADALAAEAATFNPFVRIAPDGTVTVLIKHLDKGQGIATGLSTLVAEELDADWAQVRPEFAPANAKLYANLAFGTIQGTGGSTSVSNSWDQYRKAGATARAVLVEAAAQAWKVPAAEITVAEGKISHASGKTGGFGDFAEAAAALTAPADVPLKDPAKYVLIGKDPLPRLDSVEKTDGTAIYTQDIKRPGMLVAVVAHPPRFGGKVKSFDAAAAKQVKGVEDVVAVPSGVAVLASNTWAAMKGREALTVEWDDSAAETRGTDALMAEYKALAGKPGTVARQDGDTEGALAGADKVIEAEFEFPYLAHASMEPMNCVVEISPGKCEIWNGDQFQTVDQSVVAKIVGLEPENVFIHTLWAGGSFGRRAVPDADYVAEAASIAKAIDGRAPVKLVWTREDDMRGGKYRPMYFHKVKAGLDADGNPVGWQHHIVGQSIMAGTVMQGMIKDGIDPTSVEGVYDTKYKIPNMTVHLTTTDVKVPVLWWRSVGHTHTAHAMEVMVDALAAAAGKDPAAYRMALLEGHPRHQGVLKLATEKAGWGETLEKGRGRGVSVHESFSSYVAQVVDVTMQDDGTFKVDRVVAAIDCGRAVNPDVIRAQVEGGIGFGLGAALRNAITMSDGVVDQGNFDTYETLRIEEMPKVEVHIVESTENPTGVGEPGVPPIAPAVSNAIFAATGNRIWSLPFSTAAGGSPA